MLKVAYDFCRIGAVAARQKAKAVIKFSPSSAGSSVLLVNFDSDQLRNIKSFMDVVVKD